ncbi:ribonuclease H-like domain-containing protein [Tanacetum coccineum]
MSKLLHSTERLNYTSFADHQSKEQEPRSRAQKAILYLFAEPRSKEMSQRAIAPKGKLYFCADQPVKRDEQEFFFEQLCESYEVDKFLRTPTTESSTNSIAPLTPEEINVDKIVSRTNSLKAALRSIKLGDQIMESYFQKVDSLINILTSLDAHVNEEDVVHYVLDGLSDTYNHSRALASPMDSSSPMVLVAETGTNQCTSSTAQGKFWKPCFNFAKGACRYGDSCRYAHDTNARVNNANSMGRGASNNNTHELLTKLIAQLGNLGMHNGSTVTMPNTVTTPSNVNMPNTNTMATIVPMAFHVGPSLPVSPANYPPPGFTPQSQLPYCYYPTIGSASTTPS